MHVLVREIPDALSAMLDPHRARCRPSAGAVGTDAADDQVDVLGGEAVAAGEVVANLLDEGAAVVGHLPAAPADEMELLVGVGHLPVAFAVLEPDLFGEAELRQQREGAVDAGDVEAGDGLSDPLVDLLDGEVALGLPKRLPHQAPLRRQPVALVTEAVGDIHRLHRTLRCIMRITTATSLDQPLLHELEKLLAVVEEAEGAHPLGERKRIQLAADARDWTGVLARTDSGELIGYAHLRWRPAEPAATDTGTRPRATVETAVHPGHDDPDGLTKTLLDEARTAVARAGGGLMHAWAHRVTDPEATTIADAGFTVDRVLAVMTCDLPQRPEVPEPPEGVHLRSYRPGPDDAELLRVNNAAFAGHPEQGDWDADTLAQRRALDWFDPEGVLLAWRDDELLGFHWTKRHAPHTGDAPRVTSDEEAAVGELYVLAVHPDAQGLGLGRLLLTAGLAHLYDRGCRAALLYADTAQTGPMGLYASAGFTTRHYEVCYAERTPPTEG